MLAAGVRHRLPGQLGRNRAVRYLLNLLDQLARQQVGRARADLQERLASSTRAMLGALAAGYTDHGRRMLDALDAAESLLLLDAEQGAIEQQRLADRRRRLTSLLRRMNATAPPDVLAAMPRRGSKEPADGIRRVISSPLRRATATADAIIGATGAALVVEGEGGPHVPP